MFRRIGYLLAALLCTCSLPSAAQTLITDIPVNGFPEGVAVNPSINRIYVAVTPNNATPELAVIDGASNTVVDTVPISKGAFEVAVNIATNRVYVAGCILGGKCALTVIDGSSDKVLKAIPITTNEGIGVQGLAVNPVTNRIYLSDASDVRVDVIDGYTNKIIDSISLGGGQPLGLAVDVGTNQIAIALDGPYLYIASGSTNKLVSRTTIGEFAANVAVNPYTSEAYVTNETFAPSTIAVVNMKNAEVEANVATGNNPFGVCVDVYTNLVFVTNTQDSTVAVVDGFSKTKIGSVNANSFLIDVNPVTRLVYATDGTDSVVHVISE